MYGVVLDTNVLVSGLAYPISVPGRIVAAWRRGGLDVVLSYYILDAMVRVLPRLSKVKLSSTEIRDLADSLMFLADVVESKGEGDTALRDPDDQPIPATLVESHYLITGDKDLLALSGKYAIVTPAAFWAKHGE